MEVDAYDPLEVFPLEVWECILEKLRKQGSSPRDVLNCSKVCTEFQRILVPTKREWLFGSICPFVLPYLKGRQLLACRRVCKNWRHDIDNFLKDFETWRPFDEGTSDISRSTRYDPLELKKIKWTSFKDERRLVQFLEAMEKEEIKTPFVGGSVSFGSWGGFECGGRAGSEFLEKALELLSLYGDHIWHLRVAPKDDFSSSHFYQILNHILSCTPNLKSLILDLSNPDHGSSKDIVGKLQNLVLGDHPLPEISSLETLEICTSSTPFGVLEKLISKLNLGNLKCLKLHYRFPCTGEQHVVVTPLQHLTELHVSGICWDDLEHIFNNMISPTAPLGRITLQFPGDFGKRDIDFDRMSNIINRWKGTLRMLAIQGCHCSKVRLSLSKLEAPNLKSLELEEIIIGPEFLPPALTTSLEYLHIRYIYSYYPLIDPGKEFCYNVATLHESSIWSEMEKLKVIRIQTKYSEDGGGTQNIVCTRQMNDLGIPAKKIIIGYRPWYYNLLFSDSDDDSNDDSDDDSNDDSDDDFDYNNDFEDDNFDVGH